MTLENESDKEKKVFFNNSERTKYKHFTTPVKYSNDWKNLEEKFELVDFQNEKVQKKSKHLLYEKDEKNNCWEL